jgi:SOS-response transcriptional repressor LexA
MTQPETRKIPALFRAFDNGAWLAAFGERAREIREASGLTQLEFGALLGKAHREAIARFERGESKRLPVNLISGLLILAKASGASVEWIFAGTGPKLASESKIQQLDLIAKLLDMVKNEGDVTAMGSAVLEKIMQVTDAQERRELGRDEPGLKVVDAEEVPAKNSGNYVPLIGRLAAGRGIDTIEAESYPVGIASRYLRYAGAPKGAFAVQVKGDSMSPDYMQGDIVIVDPRSYGKSGEVCAIIEKTLCGDRVARIKRLVLDGEVATLESVNASHKPVNVKAANIKAYRIWKHLRSS